MSTITAVLEADPDGTLHVPLPQDLQRGKVRIVATLEAVEVEREASGTPLEAFKQLRKIGGLSAAIPDPVAWQREQRADRPLPGRD